ncbi:O-antigen ligase family protein [Candidatus Wolfebacteria bacterium]|nr:O-antigen ligase family protein [Candidatus Wolfebacteria bacterium]
MFQDNIVKSIKYLFYALVVLIPLIYFPTIMMPFQLSKTVIFQILTEIIFALWLGLAILNKEYRPKFTPLVAALSGFMTIVSLSVIFGSDWRAGLWSDEQRSLGLVALWHFFALFLAISSLKNKIDWRKLLFLSFGTAVVVSLIGISQKFIVFPKGANPWFHIIYPGIPERIGSTFSNTAFMAGYLLFNFFIGLWLIRHQASGIRYQVFKNLKFWLLVSGAILILAAIFLSQTLGVIVGLSAGALFLLIYFAAKKPGLDSGFDLRKTSAVLLILLVLFAGLLAITKNSSFWQKVPGFQRIANFSFQNNSIKERLITWNLSLKAFKEKPILGWGFENFRIPFDRHYDPRLLTNNMKGTYWDKPHNVVLEYLTTTGIVGLLAYLGIFVAAFYLLHKQSESNRIIFISMLIAYFTQNLFVFDTIGTYLMFFLVLGFIDSYSNNSITNNSITDKLATKQKFVIAALLAIFLIPVYYNYQIFRGANYEYWGVNYFLNQLTESSLLSFNKALKTSTPYIDDIRRNFANTVKQAYQQGTNYSNLNDLQENLANHLRLVIKRHPQGFLNYLTLAEFENIFYKFNPDYLKEAELLSLKALELSPKRQQTFYVLGKTKLLEGDIAGAYKAFEDAVGASPDSAEPHFYFGLMAYGLGDAKKGAQEIAIAEQLGRIPQKVEEFVSLGNFVGDLEHDYKKAIKYYKIALKMVDGEINGGSSVRRQEILLKLAIAYYFDRNYEKSREMFLELNKTVNLKTLPIYPDLKPVLQELGIEE